MHDKTNLISHKGKPVLANVVLTKVVNELIIAFVQIKSLQYSKSSTQLKWK